MTTARELAERIVEHCKLTAISYRRNAEVTMTFPNIDDLTKLIEGYSDELLETVVRRTIAELKRRMEQPCQTK